MSQGSIWRRLCSKDSKKHKGFGNFFGDPRAEPKPRVPSEDNKHPAKGLMPTLGPEVRWRVRGERVVEERWPQKRGLVEESDADEGHEGVYHLKPSDEGDPGRYVDGRGDSVTLDRWQG